MFGGRNPVGEIVFYDKSAPYTVAGVFEDFPKNSTLSFDALIPLRNIAPFTDINGWRPNMKWSGTDCFRGYVKLVQEPTPIRSMQIYGKSAGNTQIRTRSFTDCIR